MDNIAERLHRMYKRGFAPEWAFKRFDDAYLTAVSGRPDVALICQRFNLIDNRIDDLDVDLDALFCDYGLSVKDAYDTQEF